MKDISLHLMDIAQNSIAAGADRIAIALHTEGEPARLVLEITDDGLGMDAEFLKKVTDPFKTTRTTRHVGMGLPLLKQSAEMAGGVLTLRSEPLKGTMVKAVFEVDHVDRIPLGDLSETLKMLIMANPQMTWMIKFTSMKSKFGLDTRELKQQLEGVPISHTDVLNWIQNTIEEGINMVFGGVLDEVS